MFVNVVVRQIVYKYLEAKAGDNLGFSFTREGCYLYRVRRSERLILEKFAERKIKIVWSSFGIIFFCLFFLSFLPFSFLKLNKIDSVMN